MAFPHTKKLSLLKDIHAIQTTSTLFLKLPGVPTARSTIPGEDFCGLSHRWRANGLFSTPTACCWDVAVVTDSMANKNARNEACWSSPVSCIDFWQLKDL